MTLTSQDTPTLKVKIEALKYFLLQVFDVFHLDFPFAITFEKESPEFIVKCFFCLF